MKVINLKKQWWKYKIKLWLSGFRHKTKSPSIPSVPYKVLHWGRLNPVEPKLCLVAHFDHHNHVGPDILKIVSEVKKYGHFKILFCTTSERIELSDRYEELKQHCELILKRENKGLDFGSWHTLLKYLSDQCVEYHEVLLLNDSVLGPYHSLEPLFKRMEELTDADFIGLCDSYEHVHHLQSFFLLLKARAMRSQFINRFIENFDYGRSRFLIIWLYELGLTQNLLQEGLKGISLFDLGSLSSEKRFNPTMKMGAQLVASHHFPFIKKKVVTKQD